MNRDFHLLNECYQMVREQQQPQIPRDLQQQYPNSDLNYYPGQGWVATPKVPNDGKQYFVTARVVRPDQPQPTGGFNQLISVTPTGGLDLNERILFDFDKSQLKPEGKRAIDNIVKEINRAAYVPGQQATVTGYTDLYGGSSYNQQLGASRAEAVARALQNAGLQMQIKTVVGGMKNPKVPLQHELVGGKAPPAGIEQQQPNRRVEIQFNPPLAPATIKKISAIVDK